MKHDYADYTIAWICALPLELAAAEATLDEIHERLPRTSSVSCTYILGTITGHNVVLACLPSGIYGTTSAASIVASIQATFPMVRYGVVVGIGGGVPSNEADIRLGDVVISKPDGTAGGVIQYDFGKALQGGQFQPTGMLNSPPTILLTAMAQLQAYILRTGSNKISEVISEALQQHSNMINTFAKPRTEDRLFYSTYNHLKDEKTCQNCDGNHEVTRHDRPTEEPYIHYGIIASGNQVIKDGQTRDRIARQYHALCFEMEAAGIMNNLPCLVIRGICDYCDSHKNKEWQGYAALTAATYTKLLLAEIPAHHQVITEGQSHSKAYWMVPFQQNPRFIGRTQEVADLEEKILGDTGVQKAAISGLGGVGKTQIALAVAYQIQKKDRDRSVFWIPSTSLETVEQAFQNIGKMIRLQDVAPAEIKSKVQDFLNSDQAGSWLLIIDNADDMDMWTLSTNQSPALKTFLPRGNKHGFILFTTRNQQLATKLVGPDVVRISEMGAAIAKDLLRNSLSQKELIEDELSKLIDSLHGLPLAIIQAASYINENLISLAQYMMLLNQQESGLVELLSHEFEDNWRYANLTNPVATTWLISFDQIRRSNILAANYLSFMACIDPREIPKSLLPSNNDSLLQQTQALGVLKSYSFITEHTNSQLMSIHRLVHLAMRNWLNKENTLGHWMTQASERLEEVFPSDALENRPLWRAYLPHAQFVLQSTKSFEGAEQMNRREELREKVGHCLNNDGRYNEAGALFRELFEIRMNVLGPDHPYTLISMDNLGIALGNQGKYKEAEAIHRQAFEGYKKVLGLEHPYTLASMSNLGFALNSQGEYKKAEAMHRQAFERYKKVLGPDNPSTLTTIDNLGRVLNGQGEYKEAEAMHRQAFEGYQKVLGPDHSLTIISMNNLGIALFKQGKYKEAEAMHQQAFEGYKKVLGLDHPYTLASIDIIGLVLDNQGRYKEAEAMHRQAFERYKKVLGPDHPDTLTSMLYLASTLKDQGSDAEALELLQACVQLRRRKLGPNHPDSISATDTLNCWQ